MVTYKSIDDGLATARNYITVHYIGMVCHSPMFPGAFRQERAANTDTNP